MSQEALKRRLAAKTEAAKKEKATPQPPVQTVSNENTDKMTYYFDDEHRTIVDAYKQHAHRLLKGFSDRRRRSSYSAIVAAAVEFAYKDLKENGTDSEVYKLLSKNK